MHQESLPLFAYCSLLTEVTPDSRAAPHSDRIYSFSGMTVNLRFSLFISCNIQLGYIRLGLHSHRELLQAKNGCPWRWARSTDLLPGGVTVQPDTAHQIGTYDLPT